MTRRPSLSTNIAIPLICPNCAAESETMLTKSEPKATVKIILPCYECGSGGKDMAPIYKDAEGNELWPDLP